MNAIFTLVGLFALSSLALMAGPISEALTSSGRNRRIK